MTRLVLLFLHLLGASVWVGGHLILVIRILPKAMKNKEVESILAFEKNYEPIGIPALLTQVITGILLALHVGIGPELWFSFSNPVEKVISVKLLLLLATAALAIHARFFIIPKLSRENLPYLASHIITVSILSLGFVLMGLIIRMGGLSG